MAAVEINVQIMAGQAEAQSFFQDLPDLMILGHFPTPQRRDKLVDQVNQYYKKLAELAQVQEEQLRREHFAAVIAVFKTQITCSVLRNRILGLILAVDILRTPVEQSNGFLEGDVWLSKQLIAGLLDPQNPQFELDVTQIFNMLFIFSDQAVFIKYYKFNSLELSCIPLLERPSVKTYLGRIFPSLNSSSLNRYESENSSESDEEQGRVDAMVAGKTDGKAPTDSSPMSANFLLTMCCPSQNLFVAGSLIFLVGLTLVLSTVVTALPSFGLSIVPSLGIGGAAMVVGGTMVLGALGFFGSPKSSSASTGVERSCNYRTPFYSA